jgi:four helix bundle protein
MQRAAEDRMVIREYKDLIAWQLARQLERKVFAFTATSPARTDFDFCRQVRKSASSAPRNMVEGFGRFWPAEFAHKMRIAIGELEETQDHLEKAIEEAYISRTAFDEMWALADRSIGASVRFVQYLETSGEDWKRQFRASRRAARKGKTQPKTSKEGTSDPSSEPQPEN